MTVGDAYRWMDAIAPFETAEGFDNVGLLIGDENASVSRVLFTLDVTEGAVREALQIGAELIIAHHPLIFNPLKRISYGGAQGRILSLILTNRLSVIAAHTNLDIASGGISDSLASAIGLTDVERVTRYVRAGRLPHPMRPDELKAHIAEAIHFEPRLYGAPGGLISTVAVAGGAFGMGAKPAMDYGADAYLVGEIHHHELLEVCASGLAVYDGGHHFTEQPGVRALYKRYIADAEAFGMSAEPRLREAVPYGDVVTPAL